MPEILSNKSLYFHPARAEAFGVSVIEEMIAVLPAIVTKTTGASSVVSQINDSMIVDPNPDSLFSAIISYFALDEPSRMKISKRAKEEGKHIDAESKTEEFKRVF